MDFEAPSYLHLQHDGQGVRNAAAARTRRRELTLVKSNREPTQKEKQP